MGQDMNGCCQGHGQGCCQDHHHHHHKKMKGFDSQCDHTNMFVSMADEAWKELFMDKAKAHWEKVHGKKIDEYAETAVKISMDFHMQMMDSKKQKHEAAHKIKDVMSSE